ncbi:hypothetical protein BGZ60DRAFT_378750 [Tricladium varicosporioides]|nr:hypothetical protein BGZ60DRAFT_378750 [Hymenoscyphus varicosporioides]
MLATEVSREDLHNFAIVERVASSLSLAGISFIILTYLISPAFHKPINRLVFYASLGNIFTNVATLISRDAITGGAMCTMQAFLIQMFMPADAYWTLAMACNVWLTFYQKYNARQLRRLEKYYWATCYGLPLIPAIVFCFIKTKAKGPVYGSATLWCWIDNSWDVFRIAIFYGPVWVVIFITIGIYSRAGKDIYAKRQQMQDLVNRPDPPPVVLSNPFTAVSGIQRTTDISVNYEDISPIESTKSNQYQAQELQYPQPIAHVPNKFSVNITSAQPNDSRFSLVEKIEKGGRLNTAIAIDQSANSPMSPRPYDNSIPRKYSVVETNRAIWSYTKVSLLFFVAMMITWIPSSANRVYSVVHPGHVSVPLEYAAALVLPLQGFWNAVIYSMTSFQACKDLWANIKSGRPLSNSNILEIPHFRNNDRYKSPREDKFFTEAESGSMTELNTRPRSDS